MSHSISPFTIWLTGLSGAGKSTLACALQQHLKSGAHSCCILDGDKIRDGLCRDLGYTPQDRSENIRRVAETAKLMNDAGLIVIAALISPYRRDREHAKQIIGEHRFFEIYVSTPLAICETRDPKGHYRQARAGQMHTFTGITAPYEPPLAPALTLDTSNLDIESCITLLLRTLTASHTAEA